MEQSEIISRIAELEQQIAALPVGSISTKRIDGREYYYRRWTEGKKRREKYLPANEVDALQEQIEQRRLLEVELKKLRGMIPTVKPAAVPKHDFVTNVRTGDSLRSFAAPVLKFKKRECYQKLYNFLYGELQDKVFILYGLRRTGKTTMIR